MSEHLFHVVVVVFVVVTGRQRNEEPVENIIVGIITGLGRG